MTGPAPLTTRDILWRQYELQVGLYKFYLDLVVKITVFYYAVSGAILTYYFEHAGNGLIRYALLLPFLFSIAISGLFFYGGSLLRVTREELFSIRDKLGLETAPEVQVLVVLVYSFGGILALTGAALAVFFFTAA